MSYYRTLLAVGGYSPELQAVIARAILEGFTLPTVDTLKELDVLIITLISNGVFGKSDLLLNFAYNDVACSNFSRINFKNPTGNLADSVGSSVYEINGFRMTTANTGYIQTNFNPVIHGVNYTLNNAGRFGVMAVPGTINLLDNSQAQNLVNFLRSGFNTTNVGNINSTTSSWSSPITINTTAGSFGIFRETSSDVYIYKQSNVYNGTVNSTIVRNSNQLINRPSSFNFGTYSFYCMGGFLTNSEFQEFRIAYNTYLSSIGLPALA